MGDQEQCFIAMECVPNTLQDEINAAHTIALERTLVLIEQIASALSYIHQQKCIHRDLKPSNILLRNDGKVVLADFGIAKFIDSVEKTLTELNQIIGSPLYMSPEQASSGAVSVRSDIYSLGVLMFQLLAGKLPYRPGGENKFRSVIMQHLTSPIPMLPMQLCNFNLSSIN